MILNAINSNIQMYMHTWLLLWYDDSYRVRLVKLLKKREISEYIYRTLQ